MNSLNTLCLIVLIGISLGCTVTQSVHLIPDFDEEIVLPTELSEIKSNPSFGKGVFEDKRNNELISTVSTSVTEIKIKAKNDLENLIFEGVTKVFRSNGHLFESIPGPDSFPLDVNLIEISSSNTDKSDVKSYYFEMEVKVFTPKREKEIYSNNYSATANSKYNPYQTAKGNVAIGVEESMTKTLKTFSQDSEFVEAINKHFQTE